MKGALILPTKKRVNDEVLQMIIKCARREISESEAARKANAGHTVKSYCRRKEQELQPDPRCKFCGAELTQTEGHCQKHFCDQSCYFRWRYAQGDLKRTVYKKMRSLR